jgi:hypothetical protein
MSGKSGKRPPHVHGQHTSISAAAASNKKLAANPFETEDDVSNPFLDSKPPKNPFEEEDDYDPSLNPFEN